MTCSAVFRTREEMDLDRKLRLEYPLILLKAGDNAGAVRAGEELAEAQSWTKALVVRFAGDVEHGWSAPWARHQTLEAAARELAAGPIDRPFSR